MCGGAVHVFGVVPDHAGGGEGVGAGGDSAFHDSDPLSGEALGVSVEEGGDDILLEDLVEGFGVSLVLLDDVFDGVAVSDGPSVGVLAGLVGFVPPSVEDGGVGDAVGGGFHSAGAACFEGSAGVVEPHIDALDEFAAGFHVVVFKEEDFAFEGGFLGEFVDGLDEFLSGSVAVVGFAGEEDLDFAAFGVEEFFDTGDVGEEEVGSFIGGEAPGESDEEGVGVEAILEGLELAGAFSMAGVLGEEAGLCPFDEGGFLFLVGLPEFFVGDVEGSGPLGAVLVLVDLEVGGLVEVSVLARVEACDLGAEPGGHMDAVGHSDDGVSGGFSPGFVGGVAVEEADAVGVGGVAEGVGGHVEDAGACGGGFGEGDDVFDFEG